MSTLIENPNLTCFDCDDTLIIWPKDYRENKPGRMEFEYGGEKVYLIPHSYHVIFAKHCHNRGDFVVIWSANGYKWAKTVADRLGLTDNCSVICQKPTRHVDDKESISSIAGSRVFVPHEVYDPYDVKYFEDKK